MWNVAAPATISTSCSAGRSSSETVVPGQRADDVDQQARREHDGALADDLGLERDAQADLHVGGPQLDAPPRAWTCTPESACTALRVDAARVTVWSWPKRVSRRVESFMSATDRRG